MSFGKGRALGQLRARAQTRAAAHTHTHTHTHSNYGWADKRQNINMINVFEIHQHPRSISIYKVPSEIKTHYVLIRFRRVFIIPDTDSIQTTTVQ